MMQQGITDFMSVTNSHGLQSISDIKKPLASKAEATSKGGERTPKKKEGLLDNGEPGYVRT